MDLPVEWHTLSPDMQTFLANRSAYHTDEECALALSMHPKNAYNWRRTHPDFRNAYNTLAVEMFQLARERFQMMLEQAVAELQDILGSEDSLPDHIKLANTKLRAIELVCKANGMMDNLTITTGPNLSITGDDLAKAYLKAQNVRPG